MDNDPVRGLAEWARAQALPVWDRVGYDRARGGFHERLSLDGQPDLRASRRTRVQARQIYVYAHAASLGWYPDALARAFDGLQFMLERCHRPDGEPGFVHRLSSDNSVESAMRDTYDHAFILLALSWLYRASGDAQVGALLRETLAFVDEHLTEPDGALVESRPTVLPRRQNPHMHMVEAMLAVHAAVEDVGALRRAAVWKGMLSERFLDPQTGSLTEYFTDDWRPDLTLAGAEPGHHAEWVWLLRHYSKLRNESAGAIPGRLFDFVLRCADARTSFLPDEVHRDGRVKVGKRRLWPQTEFVKAWLSEHELGNAAAESQVRHLLTGIAEEYLSNCPPGTWIDRFDEAGRPDVDFIPASSLYHAFLAVAEADRVLGGSTGR